MRIFDAHAHIGDDVVFDIDVTERLLLEVYAENGVDGALVQPSIPRPYLEETRAIHDRIHAFTRAHPGRFTGMISINPHLRPSDIEAECRRCVEQLGFRGVKIATTAYGVSPSSRDGMRVFEIASRLSIPVMVHTGGGNFGMPHLLEKPAQAFPGTPIVIAHGGGETGVDECVRLGKLYPNIFIEPSWITVLGIEKFARELGPERLMFSSDMPQNTPTALALFRAVFKEEAELSQVLGGTAMRVFGIQA